MLNKECCKYSIVMPYIDRLPQLHNSLLSFAHWYSTISDQYEVIIVIDSKSEDIAALMSIINHWRARGVPITTILGGSSYCPVKHYNLAVNNANGEYIVLTSPEIYHKTPILLQLNIVTKMNY